MKIRTLFFCLMVLFAFARLSAGQVKAAPQLIAIKAGKIVDPETGKASLNQIILVEGKKIKDIGGNVTIPADARITSTRQMISGS